MDDSHVLPGWTTRAVVEATLVVLAVALGFWLLYRFYGVVFTVFVAVVISLAIRRPVDMLAQRGVPRSVGIALILVALVVAVVAAIIVAAPMFIDQAQTLAKTAPQYYTSLRSALAGSGSVFLAQLAARLPADLNSLLLAPAAPAPAAGGGAAPMALTALAQALSVIRILVQGFFTFTAVVVLIFFWSLEREWIMRSALLHLPLERREQTSALIGQMEDRVGAYLRGQAVLSAVIGVAIAAASLLIGLPLCSDLGPHRRHLRIGARDRRHSGRGAAGHGSFDGQPDGSGPDADRCTGH